MLYPFAPRKIKRNERRGMKVKELLSILVAADPEAVVILSQDSEGNQNAPLDTVGIENQVFVPATPEDHGDGVICGELYYAELTPELVGEGYSATDICPPDKRSRAQKCIVLVPNDWPKE